MSIHPDIRITCLDGFGFSGKVEYVNPDGTKLGLVRKASIEINPEEPVTARLEVMAPAFDILVKEADVRDAVWDDFTSHERQMCDRGSGMTQEQMTGATLFWAWLRKTVEKKPQ